MISTQLSSHFNIQGSRDFDHDAGLLFGPVYTITAILGISLKGFCDPPIRCLNQLVILQRFSKIFQGFDFQRLAGIYTNNAGKSSINNKMDLQDTWSSIFSLAPAVDGAILLLLEVAQTVDS